mmetsp:Transcript_33475/g.57368  ORF Transcript_33475/g.57368 Transcript_33475/m.57368 type:complete len:126 (-) Transcript_33475:289-666(-)
MVEWAVPAPVAAARAFLQVDFAENSVAGGRVDILVEVSLLADAMKEQVLFSIDFIRNTILDFCDFLSQIIMSTTMFIVICIAAGLNLGFELFEAQRHRRIPSLKIARQGRRRGGGGGGGGRGNLW